MINTLRKINSYLNKKYFPQQNENIYNVSIVLKAVSCLMKFQDIYNSSFAIRKSPNIYLISLN